MTYYITKILLRHAAVGRIGVSALQAGAGCGSTVDLTRPTAFSESACRALFSIKVAELRR